MNLIRIPEWRVALHETIETHRREPFVWGRRDCALFAADCVNAMTGSDLARGFRNSYRSPSGAMRALKRAGYPDLLALVSDQFEEIHPIRAGVGDIAAFVGEETPWSLGIFAGPRVTVLRVDGLGTVDRSLTARAFRIP